MADVTVNSRVESVFGNYRVLGFNVDCAATGDTIPASQIGYEIQSVFITPATAIACGYTKASGIITLAYSGGGAAAGMDVLVFCK